MKFTMLLLLCALLAQFTQAFKSSGLRIHRRSSELFLRADSQSKVVAVIGAGFGGWGACKALVEGGCDVVLLDTLPDPTSTSPYLTPSGKPFEPGTKGFWKDYPNIYDLVENDLGIKQEDIFTPCTNSSFYSPQGLEATAPVFGKSIELPSPLGQVFASAKLFERLPLADRASMLGLLYAMIDFDRDEETFKKYDRMTAHELFLRFRLSTRLVDDFIRPTLLVGLFKPPEELSAAVTMELLYFYALAHQTSFDVKWIKNKSIGENIISPLAKRLKEKYPGKLTVVGGARVTSLDIASPDASTHTQGRQGEHHRVVKITYSTKAGQHVLEGLSGTVLALGSKGMKAVVNGSPDLARASPELSAAASLGGIDCIAIRLWLDKKVETPTPANVFSRFHQLRGAGGTFFMLDQLQDEEGLWGQGQREVAAEGGSGNAHSNPDYESEKVKEEEKEEKETLAEVSKTESGSETDRGSVVACDFYNSGALMGLSDSDIVDTLLNDQDGLLQQAVGGFKGAKVLDAYVQRYPEAVSWFSPGSFTKRPPLVVPGFDDSLVCAGDWVRLGSRETKAKGLCQERAYVSGLEAGNVLLRSLQMEKEKGKGGKGLTLHKVLEVREDEPQVQLGREVNKRVMEALKPLGLDSPWAR